MSAPITLPVQTISLCNHSSLKSGQKQLEMPPPPRRRGSIAAAWTATIVPDFPLKLVCRTFEGLYQYL